MNILFLSRWYPDPPDNGSKIRVLNLLRTLCKEHTVTLISFVNPDERVCPQILPDPRPREILLSPYREFDRRSGRALLGFLSAKPRWIVDTHSPEMASLIRRTVDKGRFDLVIASQTEMASYYRCFDGIPAIFEEVELGSFHPPDPGNRYLPHNIRIRLRWFKHRRFLADLLRHFRSCTVVSYIERAMLAEAVPGYSSVHVIPNSIDVESYRARPPVERVRNSMIFAGSLRYSANLDAMTWFLNHVYPLILSRQKGVRLTITGDPGSAKLPEMPYVVQTGRVENIRELVSSASVSIAPIRTGGGTRLKILEAFALGTPVVATTKAAEGLDVQNGTHLLLADTPEDFAGSVIHLLQQPDRAVKIAENALDLVRLQYNWGTRSNFFLQLVDKTA